MTKRYEVTWMTENIARPVADDIDHAIMWAMKMAADGDIESKALPVMTVTDGYTKKITVVTIDKDYKVVKARELDRKVPTAHVR